MLKRVNRVVNTSLVHLAKRNFQLRKKLCLALAERFNSSESEPLKEASKLLVLIVEQAESNIHVTEGFYQKYLDRTFPSIWLSRDLNAVMAESLRRDESTEEFFERALRYKPS